MFGFLCGLNFSYLNPLKSICMTFSLIKRLSLVGTGSRNARVSARTLPRMQHEELRPSHHPFPEAHLQTDTRLVFPNIGYRPKSSRADQDRRIYSSRLTHRESRFQMSRENFRKLRQRSHVCLDWLQPR